MSGPVTFHGSEILPSNSTVLERVLADIEWERITAIDPDIIRTIINPWTCPVPLLPWLAWSFSVDVWDDAWSEQTKRRVIAASPEVHRIKGTRRAVRLALEALGIRSSLTEWWQEEPAARRGTFRVTVHADGTGPQFDLTLLRQIMQSVRRSKPKSRVFTVRLAMEESGGVHVGGTGEVTSRAILLPPTEAERLFLLSVHVAAVGARTTQRAVIAPRTLGNTPSIGAVLVAAAFAHETRRTTLFPKPIEGQHG